jgi:hypothetical protein
LLIDTSTRNTEILQRLPSNLAPAVAGVPRRTHAATILDNLHWLPVRERVIFELATLTFIAKNMRQPSYLAELLRVPEPGRAFRSSADLNRLVEARSGTRLAEHRFGFAAPKFWNKLEANIRSCLTLEEFKKQLKTHLYANIGLL